VLAYFDRTEPYYLTREQQFEGNPVEVPESFLNLLDSRKATLVVLEEAIAIGGAPEDSAQELTDLLLALVTAEIKGK